jgi:hypothetical protein
MQLTTFLKNQLTDFVDVYRKHLLQTIGVALTYTMFCFVVIAILLKVNDFDLSLDLGQKSILSFFFARYSIGEVYSIIDLSKTVFLFFVALFSLGIVRNNIEVFDKSEVGNTSFFKCLNFNDIFSLTVVLIICSIADFGLFKLDTLVNNRIAAYSQNYYLNSLIFLIRLFLPLIIFGIYTYKLAYNKNLKLNFRKVLFLFIAVWLFNEFAYGFTFFVRDYIFPLFLLPFKHQQIFFIESVLGIPLIAFLFLGYHSAMIYSLKQQEEPENENI